MSSSNPLSPPPAPSRSASPIIAPAAPPSCSSTVAPSTQTHATSLARSFRRSAARVAPRILASSVRSHGTLLPPSPPTLDQPPLHPLQHQRHEDHAEPLKANCRRKSKKNKVGADAKKRMTTFPIRRAPIQTPNPQMIDYVLEKAGPSWKRKTLSSMTS